MPTIHVKAGIEFKPDLFAQREQWLDAVGAEIEKRGLTVKVGDGVDVKNATDLKTAVTSLSGGYLDDLLEAIDDVVKPTSGSHTGDVVDLTKTSDLAKVLGLADDATKYAAGLRLRPTGTMNVAGAMLSKKPDPLAQAQYIDGSTFAGSQVSTGRDDLEVEAVRKAAGADKNVLYKFLTTQLNNGKTVLQKLQKPTLQVAFGIGYDGMSLDELKWDSDSHKARMLNPYVSLTVESGRMDPDPKSGLREVSVGRDTFFDVFYGIQNAKTGKLSRTTLDDNVMLRSRVRVDDESGNATRVLVGMKVGTEVDTKYGVKSAAKMDIRTDQPTDDTVAHLDEVMRTGKLSGEGWWQNGAVVDPIAQVYRYLESKGHLQKVGPHEGVMLLEPYGVARQVRGRYHLNETEPNALHDAFTQCSSKIADMQAMLDQASPLYAEASALLDKSAIVASVKDALLKLDPSMTVDVNTVGALWPDQAMPSEKLDVKKRKVVADAINSAYKGFAAKFDDDTEKKLAGVADKAALKMGGVDELKAFLHSKSSVAAFMNFAKQQPNSGAVDGQPDTFMAYAATVVAMKEPDREKLLQGSGLSLAQIKGITKDMLSSSVVVPDNLMRVETVGPCLAVWDAQASNPAFAAEFTAFVATTGNEVLQAALAADPAKALGDVRKNLVFGNLEILHRMVEEAGTLAQTLWFDTARSVYCDAQRTGWSNFIIDSFDMIEKYDLAHGLALTKEQRASRMPLDPNNMLDLEIGSDFQIELGYEVPYTTAIDKASSAIDKAAAGLLMDYAVSKGTTSDFTSFLDAQLKTNKKQFLTDVAAFAKSKGSPLAMDEAMLDGVRDHARAVDLIAKFANTTDVKTWIASNTGWSVSADQKNKTLNDLTDFFKKNGVSKAWNEKTLSSFDTDLFAATNQNQPTTGHAQLLEDLDMAHFVWSTLNHAQETIADFRGDRVVDEGKKQGLDLKWVQGTGSKGLEILKTVLD